MQRFNNKRNKTNQKFYDYRAVLTVYNILDTLDKYFTMQNGNATVAPAEKSPAPGIANWSPPVDLREENNVAAKAKSIYVYDNLNTLDRIILCFAEFMGTAMLVLTGCMGCVYSSPIPAFQIAFTFGLAVVVSVLCFGHISGSHINPAVTLASVILGHTPVLHIPLYFMGQFLGAVGGFGLLKALSGNVSFVGNQSCSPALGPNTNITQGIAVEFVLTFMLVMVCASLWDCRNSANSDSPPIKLGLTVVLLALVGFYYTGAHMNPARSFAPSLLNGDWDNWFVWWIGPLAGGIAAAVVYRFVFSKEYQIIEHTPAEVLRLNEKA